MSIGVPIKLLHEAKGHIVTVELKSGEIYRGTLEDAEDNMNCKLQEITLTLKDGSTHPLEQAYIRGSHIRFVILPNILRNAPMFRKDLVKAGRIFGQMETYSEKGRGGRGGRGRGGMMRGMCTCDGTQLKASPLFSLNFWSRLLNLSPQHDELTVLQVDVDVPTFTTHAETFELTSYFVNLVGS